MHSGEDNDAGDEKGTARVLVVDDELSCLETLKTMVETSGYQVLTASGGAEVISRAAAEMPDVVLLDVFLPDVNGITICGALKENPSTRHIPIIMMTGMTDGLVKKDCLKAGANDFLAKPVDPSELMLRIRNLLVLRQYSEISDRNVALARSRASVEKMRQEWEDTFDSLDDIITIHDRDYNVIRANKRAREILDLPTELKTETKCFLHYHRAYGPPGQCPARECMDKGVITTAEFFEPSLDRYVEVRVTPRIDKSGVVTGYIHIVRDITQRRKTQDELEKAYCDLKHAHSRLVQQEKMASIGQLAAGVAHEINNPTGFIMSNLGSLLRYTEKIREFVGVQGAALEACGGAAAQVAAAKKELKIDYVMEDIVNVVRESLEGAERLKKIVQDLKGFARIDEAEQKEADINSGIESTLNIVWNELKYKATVKKEYGELPPTKCNLGQLNQVFMNLLVNAAHAIERQGEIGIRTWAEGKKINVQITDTGCGIPQDRLSRIFEPFFTTKEAGKGTGLGLSIAMDIVKKHDGEISVNSEVGRGTTFVISIPVKTER